MKKFRTVSSVIIMVIAAVIGLFAGSTLQDGSPLTGAVLFSMIAGIACIIYCLDNRGE